MISSSQKESLIYSIIGQFIIIMVLIIFSLYYTLPGLQKIEENKANALQAFQNYNSLKKDGVSFDALMPLLAQMPDRKELLKIIQSAPEETKKLS